MRRDLRNIDLAHFAFEAVDHEGFKVRAIVAVACKDAPNLVFVDAEVEGHQGVELLVVDRVGVEMIFLQTLDADRVGLEPVNERYAKVQAGSGHRAELAEARHHSTLVLANREERRHQIEQKQEGNERDQADQAEEAAPGSATRAGQPGYRELRHVMPPWACAAERLASTSRARHLRPL